MKKIIYILFVLSLLVSCSKNKEIPTTTGFLDYYELVKMTGSFSGLETTGAQMEWQESYVLNTKERTFSKSRLFNKILIEASGTYSYKINDNQKYIELTFNKNLDIISNCTGDLKEVLIVFEDGIKLVSTWRACDGPGLEYLRAM